MNSTRILRGGVVVALSLSLAACGIPQDGGPRIIADGRDRGINSHELSGMRAAIWIDPDGCHNWIIDDGFQGYLSRRYDPITGLPVCIPIAPPGSIVGNPYNNNIPDFAL